MNIKPHFTALLTYVAAEKGGRATPCSSGYRAAIKFAFSQGMFIAIQNFPDTDFVFAGDTVTAEITLLDIDALNDTLYQGMDFEFFEADVLMGSGVIMRLLP